MRKCCFVIGLLLVVLVLDAQNIRIDTLRAALQKQMPDTERIKKMNDLAYEFTLSDPVQTFLIARNAYELSKKNHYEDGELKALGYLAKAYNSTGNYNRAIEIFLQQLEIAEKKNLPRKLATALMNIGILYSQQQDFQKALRYYMRSDSIIKANRFTDIAYNSFQNLGDLYDRINKLDSAIFYYNKALVKAQEDSNFYFLGATYIGIGNCNVKLNQLAIGKQNYFKAMQYLKLANEEDLYCEAANNLAKLYNAENKKDSALYFARVMFGLAKKDGFLSRMMDASQLLSLLYKQSGNKDSAYEYLLLTSVLKDSLSSSEKIKDFEARTIKEQIRQAELAEQKLKDEKERFQQLQLLLLGIFIPIFFLLTLLLSKRKIHIKVIKVLGIISLLLLFEYLTLLLHPFVVELTNHTPIYELMIFVSIAALLIPAHHRIEIWLINKLTHRNHPDGEIHIKAARLKIKKPS